VLQGQNEEEESSFIMSNATILAANNWNTIAKKNNVKDNGLGRALSVYEKIDDGKYDERAKAIAAVIQFASGLQKARDTLAVPAVVKHSGHARRRRIRASRHRQRQG
jgi:hypothetical protein